MKSANKLIDSDLDRMKSKEILDYILNCVNMDSKVSKEDFEIMRQEVEWLLIND